ncbi:MAG TPA: hypothetical protein VML75_15580 [Kofleriaceae bacterium]|nr:hypothetical protein [Kofleriaceae bacterium]
MKIQCEKCKEIVPLGRFELLSDRIGVTCAACGERFEVTPQGSFDSARAPRETSLRMRGHLDESTPGDECPKCGAARGQEEACRVCGLEARHASAYRERAAVEASPELDAAWAACVEAWDDQARHDQFVHLASIQSQFATAAKRYRLYLDQHPGDDRAQAALTRVTRMAAATMLQRPRAAEPDGREPYKGVVMLLLALLLLGGVGGVYLLVKRAMAPIPGEPVLMPATIPQTSPALRPGRGPDGPIVSPPGRSP